MLPDLIVRASEEPAFTIGAAALGGIVTFFLKDFFKRSTAQSDTSAKAISSLTKDVGLLEAAKDRSREKDQEHDRSIAEIQRAIQELNVKIAVVESEMKR